MTEKTNAKKNQAFEICDAYLAEHGKEITIADLRTAIGGGSMSDITKYKQDWQAQRAERDTQPVQALPAELAELANRNNLTFWNAALRISDEKISSMREALEVEKEQIKTSYNEVKDAADTVIKELEAANSEIKLLNEKLEKLEPLSIDNAKLEQEIIYLREQVTKAQGLEREAATNEKEQIRIAAELSGELKALKGINKP